MMMMMMMMILQPVGMYPGKYSLSPAPGDCSLTIHNVDISLDDGAWECQVTATSFSSQDALASSSARLTVSVAPDSVVLQYGGREVTGGQLSLTDNKVESLVCVSRNSNPAPSMSWYLGQTALPSGLQTNRSEGQSERWRSEARLSRRFSVRDQGSVLRCVLAHAGYGTTQGRHEVSVQLDILYKPVVTITRRDSSEQLEDGVSSVQLSCNVNSNPASTVSWARLDPAGHQRKVHSGPELELKPVRRENGGTYLCTASNTVGQSEPGQTSVSVMFPPGRVEVRPAGSRVVAGLGNSTRLECQAEGQPAPRYQWLHTTASGETTVRSYSSQLLISSVSYRDQGQYSCTATNIIRGQRREKRSGPVVVGVRGPPQVVSQSGQVVGIDGSDVRLEAEFCSDPSPSRSAWSWGGVVVESGEEEGQGGRFRADLVTSSPHCYLSRLTVRGVGQEDSRQYTVTVTNIHGNDTQPVRLTVRGSTGQLRSDSVSVSTSSLFQPRCR